MSGNFPPRFGYGMGPPPPWFGPPLQARYPGPFRPRVIPHGIRHRPIPVGDDSVLMGAPGAAIHKGCNLIKFGESETASSEPQNPTPEATEAMSSCASVSNSSVSSLSTSGSTKSTQITTSQSQKPESCVTVSTKATPKSSEKEPQTKSVDTETVVNSAQSEKQSKSVDVKIGIGSAQSETGKSNRTETKGPHLIKGLKSGQSLQEFLESQRKKKKHQDQSKQVDQTTEVEQSETNKDKISLADVLYDEDGENSLKRIMRKFGLSRAELGPEPKYDITSIDQTKTGTSKTDHLTSATDTEEISLSDFIWDHETGKSWESIKKKFGLETDELGTQPVKTVQSKTTLPVKTDHSKSVQARIGILKRGVTRSDKSTSDLVKTKSLKTTHSKSDEYKPLSIYDVTEANLGASHSYSLSDNFKPGSRERLKRKSGQEEIDSNKRQKVSPEPIKQAGPFVKSSNPKVFIGNVYSGVTKETIDQMFEFIPGVVAWCLRRHKTSIANTCIIVEMTSELAATNLQNTFQGTTICDRQLACRPAKPIDEALYQPDPSIRSDSYVSGPEMEIPGVEKTKKMFIGNLPADINKAKVDQLLEFIPGIVSYHLTHHKDYKSVIGVIVNTTSDIAAENIRKTLNGSELSGRKITCRYCQAKDEEVFVSDSFHKWEEKGPNREKNKYSKVESNRKAVVYIGNLPANATKAELKDYISDLMYKSIDFTAGEHVKNKLLKHAYAYVHFNHNEDAEKMVRELKDCLFFGNSIEVVLKYQQEEPAKQIESKNEVDLKTKISSGDAYTPASLEALDGYLSVGYRSATSTYTSTSSSYTSSTSYTSSSDSASTDMSPRPRPLLQRKETMPKPLMTERELRQKPLMQERELRPKPLMPERERRPKPLMQERELRQIPLLEERELRPKPLIQERELRQIPLIEEREPRPKPQMQERELMAKSKMQKKEPVSKTPAQKKDKKEGTAMLDEYLSENDFIPVIGLDYVTEYSIPNQSYASYKCSLCDANPQGAGIVLHLASHKHRLKYMERRLSALYKRIVSKNFKKSELTEELTKHATIIERKNGRGKLTLVNEQKNMKPVLSFDVDEEEEEQVKEDTKDTTSDLLSRISAYKEKMKKIEDKQKKEEENVPKTSAVAETTSVASKEEAQGQPVTTPKVTIDSTEEVIKELEETEDPVLGLDYITCLPNTLKPNMPFYNCSLCNSKSYMSLLVQHVSGYSHLIMYFKKCFLDIYQKINMMKLRTQQMRMAEMQAEIIEKKYGRGTLNLTGENKEVGGKTQSTPNPVAVDADSSQVQDMEIDSDKETDLNKETSKTEYNPPDGEGQVDPDCSKAKLFDLIKDKDDVPIVGLTYVTEFQSYDNRANFPMYQCRLCACEVSDNFIVTHLTGNQHKTTYMRRHYPETFKHAQNDSEKMEKFCRYIQRQRGREYINVVKMVAPKNPNSPVTYTKSIRVQAPSVGQDRETETTQRQTPTPPLRVVTPPFRVITPPLSVVTPPPMVVAPPIVEPPPVVPAFLARSLAINVQTVTVESNVTAVETRSQIPQQCQGLQQTGLPNLLELRTKPPPSMMPPPTMVPPPAMIPPPTIVPPPTMVPPPTIVPPPIMVPPPTMVPPPASELIKETEHPETSQANQEIKLEDRKLKFPELAKGYKKKLLLGLSSCVEIQHPMDELPPLFQCDLCKHSAAHKEILPHVIGRNHRLEFFKQKFPALHSQIITKAGKKEMNDCLNMYSEQIESTNGRETIRLVVAKDDGPWKTWKTNSQAVRFIKTQTAVKEGKLITSTESGTSIATEIPNVDQVILDTSHGADKPLQATDTSSGADKPLHLTDTSNGADKPLQFTGQGYISRSASMVDKPLQFEGKKAVGEPAVNEREGIGIADIVGEEVDETTWEAVHAEIERRINNKSIIVVEKPSKFIKTYKPFLDKFPVIGLEGLTEFQKPDQNIDPWYLCQLCHMEIDWNDVVDHVVTVLHRIKYIEKEHPQLYSLLTRTVFDSKKELKERIEEFSKGVAKPPTEFVVKVMLEMAVTQEHLDQAMRTTSETQEVKPKAPEKPEQTDRVPERKLSVLHHGTPEPVQAPIVKDYRHQSISKATAKDSKKTPVLRPKFPERFGGKTKRAVIGLEYLTEYQSEDPSTEPYYFCNLCDAKLGTRTVMQHLVGLKHRLAFFAVKTPDIHAELTGSTTDTILNRGEVNSLAEQYASEYEEVNGRSEVKVVLDIVEDDNCKDTGTMKEKSPKSMPSDVRQKQTCPDYSISDKTLHRKPSFQNQSQSSSSQAGENPKSAQSFSQGYSAIQKPASSHNKIQQVQSQSVSTSQGVMQSGPSHKQQLAQTSQGQLQMHSGQNQLQQCREYGQVQVTASLSTSQIAGIQSHPRTFIPASSQTSGANIQVAVATNHMPVVTGQIAIATTQAIVTSNQLLAASPALFTFKQMPAATTQVTFSTNQMPVASSQMPFAASQTPVIVSQMPGQGQVVRQQNLQQLQQQQQSVSQQQSQQQSTSQLDLLVQKQLDMIKQKQLELQMKSAQPQSTVSMQQQPNANQLFTVQGWPQQHNPNQNNQQANVLQQQQIQQQQMPGLSANLQASSVFPYQQQTVAIQQIQGSNISNHLSQIQQQGTVQHSQQYQAAVQQNQITFQNQQGMVSNISKVPWQSYQPVLQNQQNIQSNVHQIHQNITGRQMQQTLQVSQHVPQNYIQMQQGSVQVSQGIMPQIQSGIQSVQMQAGPQVSQYSINVSQNSVVGNVQSVFQGNMQNVIENNATRVQQPLNRPVQIDQGQQNQLLIQQQQQGAQLQVVQQRQQTYGVLQQTIASAQQNIAGQNVMVQRNLVQQGVLRQPQNAKIMQQNTAVKSVAQSATQIPVIQQQTVSSSVMQVNQQAQPQSNSIVSQIKTPGAAVLFNPPVIQNIPGFNPQNVSDSEINKQHIVSTDKSQHHDNEVKCQNQLLKDSQIETVAGIVSKDIATSVSGGNQQGDASFYDTRNSRVREFADSNAAEKEHYSNRRTVSVSDAFKEDKSEQTDRSKPYSTKSPLHWSSTINVKQGHEKSPGQRTKHSPIPENLEHTKSAYVASSRADDKHEKKHREYDDSSTKSSYAKTSKSDRDSPLIYSGKNYNKELSYVKIGKADDLDETKLLVKPSNTRSKIADSVSKTEYSEHELNKEFVKDKENQASKSIHIVKSSGEVKVFDNFSVTITRTKKSSGSHEETDKDDKTKKLERIIDTCGKNLRVEIASSDVSYREREISDRKSSEKSGFQTISPDNKSEVKERKWQEQMLKHRQRESLSHSSSPDAIKAMKQVQRPVSQKSLKIQKVSKNEYEDVSDDSDEWPGDDKLDVNYAAYLDKPVFEMIDSSSEGETETAETIDGQIKSMIENTELIESSDDEEDNNAEGDDDVKNNFGSTQGLEEHVTDRDDAEDLDIEDEYDVEYEEVTDNEIEEEYDELTENEDENKEENREQMGNVENKDEDENEIEEEELAEIEETEEKRAESGVSENESEEEFVEFIEVSGSEIDIDEINDDECEDSGDKLINISRIEIEDSEPTVGKSVNEDYERPSSDNSGEYDFQQIMANMGEEFVTVDELELNNNDTLQAKYKETDLEDSDEFIEIDEFKAHSDAECESDGEFINMDEFVTLDEEGGNKDSDVVAKTEQIVSGNKNSVTDRSRCGDSDTRHLSSSTPMVDIGSKSDRKHIEKSTPRLRDTKTDTKQVSVKNSASSGNSAKYLGVALQKSSGRHVPVKDNRTKSHASAYARTKSQTASRSGSRSQSHRTASETRSLPSTQAVTRFHGSAQAVSRSYGSVHGGTRSQPSGASSLGRDGTRSHGSIHGETRSQPFGRASQDHGRGRISNRR